MKQAASTKTAWGMGGKRGEVDLGRGGVGGEGGACNQARRKRRQGKSARHRVTGEE